MALNKSPAPHNDNHRPIANENVAIALGLPYVGNIVYLDPTNGNDTTNGGREPGDAYKTLTNAEDDLVTANHDAVVLVNSGTSGTAETGTVTWDKDYAYLLGSTGQTHMGQRSRVLTTTDSVDPCFTISGRGCIFKNIQLATYQASNDVLVNLTGDRNYFENVHFAGMGHDTAGNDATGRDLAMTGAVENRFNRCTFGLDTIQRSAANSCLEFASASSKNLFEDCIFQISPDNVAALFVQSTGADGISGWNEFRNTTWLAKWTNAADKITAAFDISAQTQTSIISMTGRQLLVGADDWEASASGHLWFEPHTSTANAIGLAINPT